MNTDKEREEILAKENNIQEQAGLLDMNSVEDGRVVQIAQVFPSSVFICVHLWSQMALPCA
jgi:hypothetical protein